MVWQIQTVFLIALSNRIVADSGNCHWQSCKSFIVKKSEQRPPGSWWFDFFLPFFFSVFVFLSSFFRLFGFSLSFYFILFKLDGYDYLSFLGGTMEVSGGEAIDPLFALTNLSLPISDYYSRSVASWVCGSAIWGF